MSRIVRSLPVLLFAFGAGTASASDIDIKLGTEVRVTTSGPPITGTLAGLTSKAIALRRNDEHLDFPLADVEKLEVLKPARKAHYPEMMLAGAAGGSVMGALMGGLIVGGGVNGPGATDSEIKSGVVVGALVGSVGGAVGGYMISRFALHRNPRWEEVEIRPRIQVGAMPVRGRGFGLTISIAF